jgi:hypothetical protein
MRISRQLRLGLHRVAGGRKDVRKASVRLLGAAGREAEADGVPVRSHVWVRMGVPASRARSARVPKLRHRAGRPLLRQHAFDMFM